jgi:flavin reductase (DIM6/NTAB) family NADH-FMN oxidoreductase RutF
VNGQGVDAEEFRATMRLLASPVVVVTASVDSEPRGATIGSFTSVSLEPPLVSFNVTRETRMHQTLLRAEHFAIHLLADDQAEIAAHFALPGANGIEQLSAISHKAKEGRPPILTDTLGIFVCRPVSRYSAGDHSVFIAEVMEVLPGRQGAPLVFHEGVYRGVGVEG